MEALSGLCLGGPLDGKRLDHYGPRYRVPLSQPLADFRVSNAAEIARVDVEVFEYVFHRLPIKG
jgi:hypothetical protein